MLLLLCLNLQFFQHEGFLPVPLPQTENLEAEVGLQIQKVLQPVDQLENQVQIAQWMVQAAQIFHAYEIVDSAIPAYKNALMMTPNPDLAYLLGHAYLLKSDNHSAQHYFLQTLQFKDPFPALLINIAKIEIQEGKHESALNILLECQKLAPNSAHTYHLMGETLLTLERPEEALQALNKALELSPEANRIQYSLGLALRQLNRADEARQAMSLAGKVGVREPDPILDPLQSLIQSKTHDITEAKKAFNAGRYQDATTLFEAAAQRDPDNLDIHVNLAASYAHSGDAQKAIAILKEVVSKEPSRILARFNLAQLFMAAGNCKDAIPHFKWIYENHPDDKESALSLGNCLEHVKAPETKVFYQQLHQSNPDEPQFTFRYLRNLLVQDQFEDGLKLIASLSDEKIKSYAPLSHLIARFLVSGPENVRDGGKGLTLAQWAMNNDPNLQTQETIALAYLELGQCQSAIEAIQKCMQSDQAERYLGTQKTILSRCQE